MKNHLESTIFLAVMLLSSGCKHNADPGLARRSSFPEQEGETARLVVQAGHVGYVSDVVFSHDGRFIASTGNDYSIKVWDSGSGKLRGSLLGHNARVTKIAISPTGRHLVSGDDNGVVLLWDVNSGQVRHRLHSDNGSKGARIISAEFSSDGAFLFAIDLEGRVHVWDTDGVTIRTFGHDTRIIDARFKEGRHELFLLTSAGDIVQWEINGDRRVVRLTTEYSIQPGDGSIEYAFCINPTVLAIGSRKEKTVRIWTKAGLVKNLSVEEPLGGLAFNDGCEQLAVGVENGLLLLGVDRGSVVKPSVTHDGTVRNVVFASNNTLLTGASSVKHWRIGEGGSDTELLGSYGGMGNGTRHVRLSPDGSLLLTVSRDDSIKLWELTTGRLTHRLGVPSLYSRNIFSSAKSCTIVISEAPGMVQFVDLKNGETKKWFNSPDRPPAFINNGTYLSFARDLDLLLVAGRHDDIVAFDMLSGNAAFSIEPVVPDVKFSEVTAIATISSGSHIAASAGSWHSQSVAVWETARGRVPTIVSTVGPIEPLAGFYLSDDGMLVLTVERDSALRVWNTTTGKEVAHLGFAPLGVCFSAFSSDNRFLTTIGHHGISLWDLSKKQLLRRQEAPVGYRCSVARSSDGKVAFGTEIGDVSILSLQKTTSVETFQAHSAPVSSIVYREDGERLLTTDVDGVTRLWKTSESHGGMLVEISALQRSRSSYVLFNEESDVIATHGYGVAFHVVSKDGTFRSLYGNSVLDEDGGAGMVFHSPNGFTGDAEVLQSVALWSDPQILDGEVIGEDVMFERFYSPHLVERFWGDDLDGSCDKVHSAQQVHEQRDVSPKAERVECDRFTHSIVECTLRLLGDNVDACTDVIQSAYSVGTAPSSCDADVMTCSPESDVDPTILIDLSLEKLSLGRSGGVSDILRMTLTAMFMKCISEAIQK